jgi:hypothetical protein
MHKCVCMCACVCISLCACVSVSVCVSLYVHVCVLQGDVKRSATNLSSSLGGNKRKQER